MPTLISPRERSEPSVIPDPFLSPLSSVSKRTLTFETLSRTVGVEQEAIEQIILRYVNEDTQRRNIHQFHEKLMKDASFRGKFSCHSREEFPVYKKNKNNRGSFVGMVERLCYLNLPLGKDRYYSIYESGLMIGPTYEKEYCVLKSNPSPSSKANALRSAEELLKYQREHEETQYGESQSEKAQEQSAGAARGSRRVQSLGARGPQTPPRMSLSLPPEEVEHFLEERQALSVFVAVMPTKVFNNKKSLTPFSSEDRSVLWLKVEQNEDNSQRLVPVEGPDAEVCIRKASPIPFVQFEGLCSVL